jgi:sugar phosphate isomerase/epimerase
MSLACSTSAFRTPLDEALSLVSSMGFASVDLICIPGWDHIQPRELAQDAAGVADRVAALLEQNSLTPIACNVGLSAFYLRDSETVTQRLRELRGLADLMSRLGIGIASFYPGYKLDPSEWEDAFARWVRTWREVQEVAEESGVQFVVELHKDTVFEAMSQCHRLFEALPELRIAYDPSHFVMQGIDVRETVPLIERAAHVHLRDAAADKMYEHTGEGNVDFDWLLGALKDRGYAGHISIECLPGAEPAATREDILKLKAIVEERLPGEGR